MNLQEICAEIRVDTVNCIAAAGEGHLGGALSVVEVLAVLYYQMMNIDPKDPQRPGRDRLIVSKGHAGPAVYATLANRGYFDRSLLFTLNQPKTSLPSHCDMNRTTGIDMTTGSLGQGFSSAVGIALASKLSKDNAWIYTIIGDGETQEGQIWEAAMFAGNHKLDHLIAFTDCNALQLDGPVAEINGIEPLADKWESFGWNVLTVTDGHDTEEIEQMICSAQKLKNGRPCMILLHTVKGCGVKWVEEKGAANHYLPLSPQEAEAAIKEIRRA